MKPIQAGEPWETVSIDISGPFPISRDGYQYILSAQCLFTKWVESFPLRRQTAAEVAKCLFFNLFMRLGFPARLLSDQGKQFESELFSELCRFAGIKKLRTSPYKPSTNGQIERWHRTLNSMLAKVVSSDQRNWTDHLPGVLAAYRATVHEATGHTPNQLMLQRQVRLPVDLIWGSLPQPPVFQTYDQYVAHRTATQIANFTTVRDHLGKAAVKRKSHYDAGLVAAENISVNDKVWYYYPRKYTGKCPKWQCMFTGPYTVVKVIDLYNFVIQRTPRSKPIVVHRDKLKLYLATDDTNLLTQDVQTGSPPLAPEPASSTQDLPPQRPRRNVQPPRRYQDFY